MQLLVNSLILDTEQTETMKLVLVISNMSLGGAQRVMSILINYWAKKGWQLTLLTMDDGSVPHFFDVEESVKLVPLGLAGASTTLLTGLGNNLKRIYVLRKAIRQTKPDVVISFIDEMNVVTLLATRGLDLPVVVSEHCDPTMNPISKLWLQFRQWTYPLADQIIVLTQNAVSYFPQPLRNRISVIPNPTLPPEISKTVITQPLVRPAVIAMGRFVEQKRFDLLLQAFAKLNEHHPQWTLTILGDGELRPELESLRNQLGLSDRVYLPGSVKTPYNFLKQADLFVMSSYFEGFPMALCEAMACGLPVIYTDCPSGPREIIRDGIDGILVPNGDVEALAAAMSRLMSDAKERQRLAARAPEVLERFSLEKIMGMWEAVIQEVVGEK